MSFSLSVKLGLFETQFSVRFGSLCSKGGTHFVRKAMAWGWQGGGRTPQGDLWEDELHYSSSIICEAVSRQRQSKHWEKVTITCQIFLTGNQAFLTRPGIFFFFFVCGFILKRPNLHCRLDNSPSPVYNRNCKGARQVLPASMHGQVGGVHVYVCIFFCQS